MLLSIFVISPPIVLIINYYLYMLPQRNTCVFFKCFKKKKSVRILGVYMYVSAPKHNGYISNKQQRLFNCMGGFKCMNYNEAIKWTMIK